MPVVVAVVVTYIHEQRKEKRKLSQTCKGTNNKKQKTKKKKGGKITGGKHTVTKKKGLLP